MVSQDAPVYLGRGAGDSRRAASFESQNNWESFMLPETGTPTGLMKQASLGESTEWVSGTFMQDGESSHVSPRAASFWIERGHLLPWIQKGFLVILLT